MKPVVEKMVGFNKNAVLSAKEAAAFVSEARKYDSDVWLEKGDKRVDGKSIMGIMSLAGVNDNFLTICADGVDEVAALDSLVKIAQEATE